MEKRLLRNLASLATLLVACLRTFIMSGLSGKPTGTPFLCSLSCSIRDIPAVPLNFTRVLLLDFHSASAENLKVSVCQNEFFYGFCF